MKRQKVKLTFFWILTGLLCFELIYGALWDFNLINEGYVYRILEHLGYPLYMAVILAYCKLLAFVVIVIPGFALQKEWAYTGVVILFTGAFVSHVMSGDPISASGFALGFAITGLLSYLLRPDNRRLKVVP